MAQITVIGAAGYGGLAYAVALDPGNSAAIRISQTIQPHEWSGLHEAKSRLWPGSVDRPW